MGFLDKIKHAQDKMQNKSIEISNKFNNSINTNYSHNLNIQPKINNINFAKPTTIPNKIIKEFYSDYPEYPYISKDRSSDWIEQARSFPTSTIIPKSTMIRFPNGLLPGHVYLLYWLNKYPNKSYPSYFEYKYGIDAETEKIFLINHGYLDTNNRLTPNGLDTIELYHNIIKNHSQKNDNSYESKCNQIQKALNNIKRNKFAEYEIIANSDCCEICKNYDGKHFNVKDFKIGKTAPPFHESCRCSISSYSDRESYEAWLNSL